LGEKPLCRSDCLFDHPIPIPVYYGVFRLYPGITVLNSASGILNICGRLVFPKKSAEFMPLFVGIQLIEALFQ
jgi:hypothetical protein